jgi:predicted ATPase
MLLSLSLENWKSFGAGDSHRRTLRFAPLTLLVGPNASGKSNALDALRFLQGAALGYPLGDALRGRWEGQREVWPAIRGGSVEASHFGRDGFVLTSEWALRGRRMLEHSMRVTTGDDVAIEHERLVDVGGVEGNYFFDTHAKSLKSAAGRDEGGGIRVALRGKGHGNSPTHTYSSLRSLLAQVELRERVAREVIESTSALRDALREAVFLDIRPALMRDYRPENGGHLGASGENISPVLSALPADRLSEVTDWLSELCGPEIATIEFDQTKLREVMMILVEEDGRRSSARSASDGTLRFLGEVVALSTSPRGSLLVLEEPDVGLHPSRIRLLAELLEGIAAKRGVQVIATTHSPTLLAHLSSDALGNTIAFGRDPESGDTVCSRLSDLPHYPILRDAKDVEHLISTGWLERAL